MDLTPVSSSAALNFLSRPEAKHHIEERLARISLGLGFEVELKNLEKHRFSQSPDTDEPAVSVLIQFASFWGLFSKKQQVDTQLLTRELMGHLFTSDIESLDPAQKLQFENIKKVWKNCSIIVAMFCM